jgi:hypothetical protein
MKIPEPIIAPDTMDIPSKRVTRFWRRLFSSDIISVYLNKFNNLKV